MPRHYQFGMGQLVATPVGGGNPLLFGALQDVSVDFSGDAKQLWGTNQFALDTARGKVKIDIKAKWALVDPNMFNAIFFGQAVTTGETLAAFAEAGATAIPTTPFQLTVANAATFKTDLGVYFSATGQKLVQVASSPVTGQYSVNPATGVYTFATADTGKTVLFNYTYGSTTTGLTIAGQNVAMGSIPSMQLNLVNTDKGKTQTLTFYSCVCPKLSLPFKQDDYEIQEADFMAQDDGTGRVFSWTATGG